MQKGEMEGPSDAAWHLIPQLTLGLGPDFQNQALSGLSLDPPKCHEGQGNHTPLVFFT